MPITNIASFLVYPGKNMENPPDVKGTLLPLSGRLYSMLNTVFEKSNSECDIPIRFIMAEDGTQHNNARDYILAFIGAPSLDNSRSLAERLRDFTTHKPGLALFFVILGNENGRNKIVLSRFPADEGILAEPQEDTLQVEFIERIFMKNAKSYKAALYEGRSLDGDFWSGFAVDKQLQLNEIADYWIRGFLASDFITTSREGTRRLAVALREASRKAEDLETKHALVAFSLLAPSLEGQIISISDIVDRFGLPQTARNLLTAQLSHQDLMNEQFVFNQDEFLVHAPFASLELDNGGILLAPPDRFNQCFHREEIDRDNNQIRFITEGKIVDEKLKGRK